MVRRGAADGDSQQSLEGNSNSNYSLSQQSSNNKNTKPTVYISSRSRSRINNNNTSSSHLMNTSDDDDDDDTQQQKQNADDSQGPVRSLPFSESNNSDTNNDDGGQRQLALQGISALSMNETARRIMSVAGGVVDGDTATTSLGDDYKPSGHDVICGRGRRAWDHKGNLRFRLLLESRMEEYKAAKTKLDKSLLVSQIMEEIEEGNPLGRFIKQEDKAGQWVMVSLATAREKVGQGFRDLLHTKYRSSSTAKKHRRSQESNHPSAASCSSTAPSMTTTDPIPSSSPSSSDAALSRSIHSTTNRSTPTSTPLSRTSSWTSMGDSNNKSSSNKSPTTTTNNKEESRLLPIFLSPNKRRGKPPQPAHSERQVLKRAHSDRPLQRASSDRLRQIMETSTKDEDDLIQAHQEQQNMKMAAMASDSALVVPPPSHSSPLSSSSTPRSAAARRAQFLGNHHPQQEQENEQQHPRHQSADLMNVEPIRYEDAFGPSLATLGLGQETVQIVQQQLGTSISGDSSSLLLGESFSLGSITPGAGSSPSPRHHASAPPLREPAHRSSSMPFVSEQQPYPSSSLPLHRSLSQGGTYSAGRPQQQNFYPLGNFGMENQSSSQGTACLQQQFLFSSSGGGNLPSSLSAFASGDVAQSFLRRTSLKTTTTATSPTEQLKEQHLQRMELQQMDISLASPTASPSGETMNDLVFSPLHLQQQQQQQNQRQYQDQEIFETLSSPWTTTANSQQQNYMMMMQQQRQLQVQQQQAMQQQLMLQQQQQQEESQSDIMVVSIGAGLPSSFLSPGLLDVPQPLSHYAQTTQQQPQPPTVSIQRLQQHDHDHNQFWQQSQQQQQPLFSNHLVAQRQTMEQQSYFQPIPQTADPETEPLPINAAFRDEKQQDEDDSYPDVAWPEECWSFMDDQHDDDEPTPDSREMSLDRSRAGGRGKNNGAARKMSGSHRPRSEEF
ncbi:hypothetical protein ACA910_003586 [Epithemia clementina (nom. ined.)]